MKLCSTKVQPDTGQFVAVWDFNGRPWSATFRVGDRGLEEYDTKRDVWVRAEPVPGLAVNVRYLICR